MKTDKPATQAEPRNAQVRALREHSNQFGKSFAKAKGECYLHPRPAADIAAGLVELVTDEDDKPALSKRARA